MHVLCKLFKNPGSGAISASVREEKFRAYLAEQEADLKAARPQRYASRLTQDKNDNNSKNKSNNNNSNINENNNSNNSAKNYDNTRSSPQKVSIGLFPFW